MRKENMAIRQVTAMMKEKLLGDDFLSLSVGASERHLNWGGVMIS
jgi:hypothetical protein